MNKLPYEIAMVKEDCTYTYTVDAFNRRLRVDDYYGDIASIIKHVTDQSMGGQYGKLIFKARREDFDALLAYGFVLEAKVDKYFLGSDLYFFCKYFTSERRSSVFWGEEDEVIDAIFSSSGKRRTASLPPDYILQVCEENDAEDLAKLYDSVFKIYPVPLNDPDYIRKSMRAGNIFLCFKHDGAIVSAVCGDVNEMYRNAEITDCATTPEYRQFGLVQFLLAKLERELYNRKIFCLYSIARARSYGMNAAFHRLQYKYRGRLANNCNIYEDIEDMNVWVKTL